MNTAVAEIDMPSAAPATSNALVQGFSRLPRRSQFGLLAGVVALLAVLLAVFFMSRQTDWKVLYSNLSDKDGGAIIGQLTQMNVPYQYAAGGQAIMVPSDRVYDTRLRLASQGLPKGSVGGFDSIEMGGLGMTQFQERLSFQRGLEGELTRSIQSIASVSSARVHLALPNQTGFFREQPKPSASVLLSLYPGRTLDRSQIAGIVHLIASSVPEMDAKAVSVVDESGSLLSNPSEGQSGNVDTQQLQYVQQIEQLYSRRIADLLEPLLGRDNVRAQVTADVDFSQVEQTSEQYKPNQNPEQATVRSTQTMDSGSGLNGPAAGVPGAVSNVPPATEGSPINGSAGPLGIQNSQAPGVNSTSNSNGRRESVINYEVDRTVRTTRNATGSVRRINAAVVLNFRTTTNARGQTSQEALKPEEIEKMTALVREAIGFNQERGDSVNIMNSPFNREASADNGADAPAWWKQSDNRALAQDLAWPVGMLLLGLIIFFGMVRPALKLIKTTPPAPTPMSTAEATKALSALIDESPERPGLQNEALLKPTTESLRLEDARRLARENPSAVANIIKSWVSGDGAAVANV